MLTLEIFVRDGFTIGCVDLTVTDLIAVAFFIHLLLLLRFLCLISLLAGTDDPIFKLDRRSLVFFGQVVLLWAFDFSFVIGDVAGGTCLIKRGFYRLWFLIL
jgi:hypothetical protein